MSSDPDGRGSNRGDHRSAAAYNKQKRPPPDSGLNVDPTTVTVGAQAAASSSKAAKAAAAAAPPAAAAAASSSHSHRPRTYEEDCQFIRRVDSTKFEIKMGFVPNMRVPGYFYVNEVLEPMMFDELKSAGQSGGVGGFLPAVKQIANVASLPGIVGASVGLPDVHSGYGFAIGNVAAFDMDDPESIVSPGGVGFDINCLTSGTPVALADGSSRPIEQVRIGDRVMSYSAKGDGELVVREVTGVFAQGKKPCVKLVFIDGRELVLTADHRLLVKPTVGDGPVASAWVEAGKLPSGAVVRVGTRPPVVDEQAVRMDAAAAAWRVDNPVVTEELGYELNLTATLRPTLAFFRILGYLMTAGEMLVETSPGRDARRAVLYLAHSIDVETVQRDINLVMRTTEVAPLVQADSTFELRLPLKLANALHAMGLTPGKRSMRGWQLPQILTEGVALDAAPGAAVSVAEGCPLVVVRAFLSGFFGGDGDTLLVSHAKDPQVMGLSFSSTVDATVAKAQCQEMVKLGRLLERCGVPREAIVSKSDLESGLEGLSATIRLNMNADAILPFADAIGFAYCCYKQQRLDAGATVIRVQAFSARQRQQVQAEIPTKDLIDQLNIAQLFSQEQAEGAESADKVRYGVPRDAIGLPLFDLPLLEVRPIEGLLETFDLSVRVELPAKPQETVQLDDEENQSPVPEVISSAAAAEAKEQAISELQEAEASFVANGLVVHNCGVRLIRTNLHEKDVRPIQEKLTQSLFDHIPVGVGSKGVIPTRASDLVEALEMGMDWSLREGYAWAEDKEHCEEFGRMLDADPSKVSARAKKRGLPQLGTLGAGNHYCEIQIVEEIYDKAAASKMGIEFLGQVVVMVHSGSRGLGHQVATDALTDMERAMARDGICTNDKQLACARINSKEGQDYLAGMSAAANYAWVNRSSMTFLVRQTFAKMFETTPDDLDMHVIYDVSHNIAKQEEHLVDGKRKRLLVHRKGSTRAFPPHHPLIPVDYQLTGQPVLIGGSMGTCSYVLTGTAKGMQESFGSTCHGAGRAMSRNKSRRALDYKEVLEQLAEKGISIRVASPKLVCEEAPDSYKDVTQVVQTCHDAGISKLAIKLKPIAVGKG